jgi:hypothetical protein
MERMAWLRLQGANAAVAATVRKIEELVEQEEQRRDDVRRGLRQGTRGADLLLDCSPVFKLERERTMHHLEQLLETRMHEEEEFMRTRQQREIVENAIARARTQYEADRSRRVQSASDDLILQQRIRNVTSIDKSAAK